MNKPKEADIQIVSLITNGNPHQETLKGYFESGWEVLTSGMAGSYHPYAKETDVITFFVKPINKEVYDKWMDDLNNDLPTGTIFI